MPGSRPSPLGSEADPAGAAHGRADAQRNRSSIVSTAVRVLSRAPAASMAAIADAAGLSRATVYRHFPSRESLEEAIRAEALVSARAVLEDVDTEAPASAALEQAVRGLVRLGPRFGVLLRDGTSPGEEFLRQRDAALRPLREIVRRARQDGELDPVVDETWAYQALTALLMAAARASVTTDGDPDAAADAVCRTYLRGLGTEGGRRRNGRPARGTSPKGR